MKLDTMNEKLLPVLTFGALGLGMPAAADVIYSNYQNLGIPATFDGLYLDLNTGNSNTSMASPVSGWDVNLFYGGKFVQNSPGFQPVRTTTANTSAIANLAAATGVGSGSTYSSFTWDHDNNSGTAQVPGYGSSQMLSGSGGNFTAGTAGYLGFKLYSDSTYTAANYGWIRAVFTNNAAGAVIKDWAYDNTTGAAITTGLITTDEITPGLTTTTTLNPATAGDSFTLASALTNGTPAGNTNSVLKTGAGTTTLTGTNTHTGATTIQQGTLALGATGSIANSTTLVVGDTGSSGAVLDVSAVTGGFTVGAGQTLKGIGTVSGATMLSSGAILAPGNSVGKETFTDTLTLNSGSIFEWELGSTPNDTSGGGVRGTDYDAVNVGGTPALAGSGAIFRVVLNGSQNFSDNFWNATHTWSDIFKTAGGGTDVSFASLFSGVQYYNTTDGVLTGVPATQGSFTYSGTTLTWTAVPEPTSALAGLLLGAGLLRRRRSKV